MSILYFLLIIAIVAGMNWWLGSWNILINLINFFIASLVASSFFEPLATKFQEFDESFVYLVEFVAVWVLFVATFVILRVFTDFLSKYQLRMDFTIELVFRTVLSLWLAAGFAFFTFFTFHLAPFPPGEFTDHPGAKLYGIGPDLQWLAFIQSRSRGALSESVDAYFLPEYDLAVHPDDKELGVRVFDPFASFTAKGFLIKSIISQNETLRVTR